MSFFKYYLILFFLAGATYVNAQQQPNTLTLSQCVDIAIKTNLAVKQSGLAAEQDRIYRNQAKENMLPFIGADASHTISNGRSQDPTTYNYVNQQITYGNYSLSGNLTLFNGLNLMNSVKQYSLAYEAGKMDFQQAKDLVTITVITSYLLVLGNEDLLTQAQGQVQVSKQQLERQQILFKEGQNKPSDLYDIQGQLANDQLSVINAQTALDASKLSLLQTLNVPYNKDIQLEHLNTAQMAERYAATSNEVYNTALNELAQVKAVTLRRQSAEKEVKAAKGLYYPTLFLGSGIFTNYSSTQQNQGQRINYYDQFRNNYSTQVSLGLHVPILNYFRTRNGVSLAKIDLLNAQYVEESTKTQLKQNVEQAYVNMTSAAQRYNVLVDQVKAFTESYRTAEIRFNAGSLTSVDFVVAKNNMDRANSNLISAKYDYYIRTKILDYYQGKLAL